MTTVISAPIAGKIVPGLSMPPLPILLGCSSMSSSALLRPRYTLQIVVEAEPELTPRRVFEMLVSAACYLSLSPLRKAADALEAVQLLHDLAEELCGESLQPEAQPEEILEETRDQIWKDKQIKWERLSYIEAAVCLVKARSPSRHFSQSLLKM